MDHDHHTMVIRGLLCVRCNRAIAQWMTPEWLEAAAEYLRSAPAQAQRMSELNTPTDQE